jgi:hypothetical protein
MLPETVEWKNNLIRTRERDILTRGCVCLVNVLITPFVLLFFSIKIYLLPCIQACISTICCKLLFTNAGFLCCTESFLFTDQEFPPNSTTLGKVAARTKIGWKRVSKIELQKKNSNDKIKTVSKVFESGIEPNDIAQGQLGDCWLMSALAALSEQPETIRNCFLTDAWNPRGKYQFRLWDDINEKFIVISIDDYIPVDESTGQPVFSKPKGNEMWVMLIEKAIAKLNGSYANIEGGFPLYAMRAITGDEVNTFQLKNNTWLRLDMKVLKGIDKHDINFCHATNQSKLSNETMYNLLLEYSSAGYILAAGTKGKDNTIEEGRGSKGGLVPGHAYSILQVYKPKLTFDRDIKLLKLRNPWGSFEWQGDWSDNSDLWNKHPGIRLEMGFPSGSNAKDDGIFFMSWDDFIQHFDGIDVCYRSRDMDDIQLDLKEDLGVFGPTIGCIFGCTKYWLCCCGFYHLWCAKSSSKNSISPS